MIPLATENVTKVFNAGKPGEVSVLRGVSVNISAGEVAVLRGPSGSGKTTLLGILGCMARPTSGKVLVGGENVAKLPEKFLARHHRDTFGFIFQQFNLIPELSVIENVMVPLYPTGMPFGEMRKKALAAIEELELGHRIKAKPKYLSGGEQQRVAVARALVNDPDVLIADEPTAHLDGALSRALLAQLSRIRDEGRTVIISTHDPLVYEQPFVDRIIDLRDGVVSGEWTR